MYQVFFIILILDRLDWCCVFVFHILYFGIYTHVGVGTHTRACSCACTTRSQAPTTQPSLFRVVLAPSTFIPPISQAFIPSHWCLKPVCSLWLPESARWHCILPVHCRIQTSLMKRSCLAPAGPGDCQHGGDLSRPLHREFHPAHPPIWALGGSYPIFDVVFFSGFYN